MLKWLQDLDRILRGEATSLPALRQGRIDVRIEKFFRDEAWGNAYLVVGELIWKALTR
ncbi:MAG TPA: hypothetical protein VKU82_11335 [Planctomycetaceae bacterium]|nr:hypothetical protein [Planctomycetaceae bacterium]